MQVGEKLQTLEVKHPQLIDVDNTVIGSGLYVSINVFAIGDGAGVTRGLSQAGASGVYVARQIIERSKK